MILKELYWDIRDSSVWRELLYEIVRNAPGRFGFSMRRLLLGRQFKTVGKGLRVHKGCRIINTDKMSVGDNVHFGVDSYIQAGGGISIGDFTEMGPGVKIWSQTHVYDDPDQVLEGAGYEYKPVVIERNVWIGANVFIMPGVALKEGSVVAAGAVVGVKQWVPNSIIAGNPARKIGERGTLRKQKL
jgi:maltose O-acetyltransferase